MCWLRCKPKKEDVDNTPTRQPTSSPEDATRQARSYLEKVHAKIDKLAADFAKGAINRVQFQQLYGHYQREIRQIESILETDPQSWQQAMSEGQSVIIRRHHMARAKAYAIYDNETGLPLGTLGKFRLDPVLVVPMFSSYRSATQEIFGSGMRLTQTESGEWLCFVPGEYTTLMAVFINEPVPKQLKYLSRLHHHFEKANRPHLMQKPMNTKALIYPHEYFLGKWSK